MTQEVATGGGKSPPRKTVRKKDLLETQGKLMEKSYQRAGIVGAGTLLSSGARQVTCTFSPAMLRDLKFAAAKNGVSLSEMLRQCVMVGLYPRK